MFLQVEKVLSSLTRHERQIIDNIEHNMLVGGLMIQRDAQGMTPVMTGNLRAGAFTDLVAPLHVVVGYQADYAIFVHENVEAHHPVGEAKFLEKSVNKNRKRFFDGLHKGVVK